MHACSAGPEGRLACGEPSFTPTEHNHTCGELSESPNEKSLSPNLSITRGRAALRMNLNLVELDVLHVEAYQIKEVLKVIFPSTLVRPCRSQLVLRERHRLHPLCQVLLHSIIFQRALHAVAYRDCESELFDIAYVRVDSQAISKRVEDYGIS